MSHLDELDESRHGFRFLDRLRQVLLDHGAPGREEIVLERAPGDLGEREVRLGWRVATLRVGDQKDEGDTVLVLFSDRTEVAEAEYFRDFESCTVRWTQRSTLGPPGNLSLSVVEGVADLLKSQHVEWDGR
jgi:hypothetical protein